MRFQAVAAAAALMAIAAPAMAHPKLVSANPAPNAALAPAPLTITPTDEAVSNQDAIACSLENPESCEACQ